MADDPSTSDPESVPFASALTFTDRSRFEQHTGKCPRAFYLSTAYGRSGYGIQRRRVSTPLASGTMLHEVFGAILRYVMEHDTFPPDHVTRDAIALGHAKYDATVVARGLQYWEGGDEAMQRLVAEQKALIEGLAWCWVLEKLPGLLDEYRVVSVEQEEVAIYACTCGIGDGIGGQDDHDANGCEGVALQTKADWIGQHRDQPDAYTYHEFKTFGMYASAWADKWDTAIQPHLGTVGWEQRTGRRISGIFVHGLNKGQRKKEKALGDTGRTYTGPEYQDSRLVQGYCKPGAPPLIADDWQASYDWVDETGKNRKLGPSYQKRLTSLYPGGVEAWVREMPSEDRQEHVLTVGPILPEDYKTQSAVEAWVASELRARAAKWLVADAVDEAGGDWTADPVQSLLNQHFPQSWNCMPYGRKHACEFKGICQRQAGWQDPEVFLEFVPRRPHHDPELQQAVARGLLVPEDMGEDDAD